MKKISGVIIAFLLVIVTLFGFAGCGSGNQSELPSKIDELQSQIQKLEDKLSELDEHNKDLIAQIEEIDGQLREQDEKMKQLEKELYGSYNEAGEFYEREANDYISAFYDFAVSSIYRYRIGVEHDDKNLVFVCSVEVGSLSPKGNTVELKSGEYCWWGFENYRQELWDYTVYVDIIAKKGDRIIGYGVVGFFPCLIDCEDSCKVLKFAIFPKVKGEYQTVSEEQIKRAMDEIKNESEGK